MRIRPKTADGIAMILSIVFWVFSAFLLTLALVLILPVRFRLWAEAHERRRLRLELGLLGGRVPWVPLLDTARDRRVRGETKKVKLHKKKRPKRRGLSAARGRRILCAAPGLLRGLLRRIRLERFHFDCIFGTGDPADTGEIFGLLAPVSCCFAGVPGAKLNLVPDFGRARFEGKAEVVLALVPIRLFAPFFRFGWAVFGPKR